MSAHSSVSSCLYIVTRTCTVAQVMSLSHHAHVHVHVSVSLLLALTFYFTHFLPHSFHFVLHLKFVDYNLLRTPHKEGMELSDEFLLSTADFGFCNNVGASSIGTWAQADTASVACPAHPGSLDVMFITFAAVICEADDLRSANTAHERRTMRPLYY